MKYVADFEEWAIEKYNQFKKVQESNPNLISIVSPSTRSVVIVNTRNGKVGFSKCNSHDRFDIPVGSAIAWARYLGEEVPKQAISTTISKLTPGERFIFDRRSSDRKFCYIGYDPVNDAAVVVCVNTGENHRIDLNRCVIKI